jgi:hypothetical protein
MMVYPDYANLQAGNYWIYQVFRVDSIGVDSAMNIYDSVYVEKDTMIRGNMYYKIMKPEFYGSKYYLPSFQRDSLHYIVDYHRGVVFSSQDFSTVFKSKYLISYLISPVDSVGYVEFRMMDRNMNVFVPAGSFITSNFCERWLMHPYFRQYAPLERKVNARYAANVGMVVEGFPFFSMDSHIYERRLIRYNKN